LEKQEIIALRRCLGSGRQLNGGKSRKLLLYGATKGRGGNKIAGKAGNYCFTALPWLGRAIK